MERFGFEQYGNPSVFESIEAPVPEPKAGQVQLQVLGFGLNPYDASLRRGEQAAFRKVKFPVVPGTDVLGRITKLGEGVSEFAVGDLVMNYRPIGGYSEFVTASTSKIYKKPTALSFLDAAALPQVGLAAFNILHYMLALKPRQTLGIVGASGGVGAILVQLAKFEKLKVIAVVILRDIEIVRAMEADIAGRFIPVTLLKSGELRQSTALVSEPALRLVMRYVERLIATMAQTLLLGDVAAEPLMRNLNACAWCPYTAVCGSERAEETAARVSMKNDEVLARMEMQVEGGKNDGGTMD